MLNIRLSAVEEAPQEFSGRLETDSELLAETDLEFAEPVSVSGRVSTAGPGSFFLQMRLAGTISSSCRRCLDAVKCELEEDLNLILAESNPNDDPSVYVIGSNEDLVELNPVLREELILSLSGDGLCKEDCKGLCAGCGVNLNTEECRCSADVDPRWSALKELSNAEQSEK